MRWITRPGWPGNLLTLAAGALTTLSLAPFDIWPLALLSIGLIYLGLRELTPKQAAGRGWCYGFGLFASGVSWVYVSIHDFGAAPPILAGALTLGFTAGLALFFALLGWLWSRWLKPTGGAPFRAALVFAALWLALDALRGWVLTGFPWLYAGYSQLEGPLAGLAPIGGVWLLSFAIVLSAALLVELPRLRSHKGALIGSLSILVVLWGGALGVGQHAWTTVKAEPITVAAMQGNVAQSIKWDPKKLEMQLLLYRDMTFRSRPVDLVVWPETAVPILKEQAEGYLNMMSRFANDRQSALITGVPVRQPNAEGELRYYNGLTSVGDAKGTYLKQKLVPFGEYVPLQDLLRGLIEFFDLPMSDFARGTPEQPLLQAKGYRIAPFICYEVVYPEFAASLAAQSDILLTVSNDAWFGHSIGPLQHLQMAQMRALEAGRWMIRATNNGVTVLIDPQGRITEQVPAFEETVLYGEVTPMQGLTPYLQWRSWPLIAVCVVLLGWGVIRRRHA
ncbi:acyltransferase [Stutzerimonas stutzeri]|uniref:Apolipoprotein N-acyltransferase n=1 Tax=Stutzerimonas stutzeri TaxID=316 RepID=W8RBH6_STUST|nr:apolipoprotein N-acyltransferase [Stutzerimonas stutzeri]AHL76998.1 acyltransferase [Stutzerimonas stutzeri]MCQ4329872.1 apolipoprotein N-acyltransferase [Stutzerimonas stutzeri]